MVLCTPYTLFLHKNYYSGKFAFTLILQYNMRVESDRATTQGASPSDGASRTPKAEDMATIACFLKTI